MIIIMIIIIIIKPYIKMNKKNINISSHWNWRMQISSMLKPCFDKQYRY